MITRHLIGMFAATAFATAAMMAETVTLKQNQTIRVQADFERSGSAPSRISNLGSERGRVGFGDIRRGQIYILGHLGYVHGISPRIIYEFCSETRMTGPQRGWNREALIALDKATKDHTFTELTAHYHRLTGQDRA